MLTEISVVCLTNFYETAISKQINLSALDETQDWGFSFEVCFICPKELELLAFALTDNRKCTHSKCSILGAQMSHGIVIPAR